MITIHSYPANTYEQGSQYIKMAIPLILQIRYIQYVQFTIPFIFHDRSAFKIKGNKKSCDVQPLLFPAFLFNCFYLATPYPILIHIFNPKNRIINYPSKACPLWLLWISLFADFNHLFYLYAGF